MLDPVRLDSRRFVSETKVTIPVISMSNMTVMELTITLVSATPGDAFTVRVTPVATSSLTSFDSVGQGIEYIFMSPVAEVVVQNDDKEK